MTFNRLTIKRVAAVVVLLLLLPGAPAGAAGDWLLEVEEIREQVGGLLAELSYSDGLSSQEVAELRGELGRIHSRLDALADRLAREQGLPESDRPGGWLAYEDVVISAEPPDAEFTVWRPNVQLSLEFGAYGELQVAVAKNGYSSTCRILDAYSGDVSASLESRLNGEIVVDIEDELGSHEFLIENGGLGPVFVRGRGDPDAA